MALLVAWQNFQGDVDALSQHFRDFASTRGQLKEAADFTFLDECLLEGILSRVWQCWGGFCRSCIVQSCIGTVDALGNPIAPLPEAPDEESVSGAAVSAAHRKNKAPYWGGRNSTLRLEPTWGDVDVLTRVVARLQPANHKVLLSAFSSVSQIAKALQLIRNGAAHSNPQTLKEVLTISSSYVAFPITHPVHALFWVEPSSSDFLITYALQELKDFGLAAIS